MGDQSDQPDQPDRAAPRRTLCLSAGGMPGLDIHCGMLLALADAGLTSWNLISGTSAGAIVGALLAAGLSPTQLEAILRDLKDSDVRNERFLWWLRITGIRYWMLNNRIKKILTGLLPTHFSDLQTPFECHTTFDQTGRGVVLRNDSQTALVPAVLASSAICGVFPPVPLSSGIPGFYSDGGTTNYIASPLMLPEPPDELWVLIATPAYNYRAEDESILSRLMLNVHILLEDQIRDSLNILRAKLGDRLHVIRTCCGADAGTLHFDHSLIDQARRETWAILKADGKTEKRTG